MERRRFLQVAGAAGLGVAAGCAPERHHLRPYVNESDDLIPGIPEYYATTCRECPAGCGLYVKTREARAIKVEGNPFHPVGHGKVCARGQAALQGLYDPDRVREPYRRTARGMQPVTWDDAVARIAAALGTAAASGPDRVALVTGAETGALDAFYDGWLAAFRSHRRLRYEAYAYEPLREAGRLTFGTASIPEYAFAEARYILSFGADFLETWLSPVEYAHQFAQAHHYESGRMARFVAVEPRRGLTGYSADEWIAPRPGTEGLLALGIAASVVRQGHARLAAGADADRARGFLARFTGASVARATGVEEAVIDRVAREFAAAEPSLAVAGGVACQHRAATQTAVAVNLLNYVAGNVGRTVRYHATSPWDRVSGYRDARDLIGAMGRGEVDVALIQGTNPAFTLPASAGFAAALAKVRLKVAFATQLDETAELCDLVLPDVTPLEQWAELEPLAGVRSYVQPTMTPVFEGTRQAADALLAVAAKAGKQVGPAGATTARELVAAGTTPDALDDLLQHGGQFAVAPARPVRLAPDFARLAFQPPAFDGADDGLVLIAYPSMALFDGRGANKGWLQELPDAAVKIAWQSWVEVHPATAARLGIKNGDIVTVTSPHGSVEAQAYVYPGLAPGTVAIAIGQGHTAYGRNAKGRGINPLDLLGADATDESGALAFCSTRVTLARTGRWMEPATTEGSPRQLGRGIARAVTVAGALKGEVEPAPEATLTPSEQTAIAAAAASQRKRAYIGIYAQPNPKWEMTIDLSRCTGCQACVTACYAENNLAVVGEEQSVRHRNMSWMRLERYFHGDTTGTDWDVRITPMLCQQCDNAPCEPVCPVYASYHTPDGLNAQIYNRCVGTRYCANNCPYKVRYFNWWDYGRPGDPYFCFEEPLNWQLNPDVTVRTKGVMEKCTFCVQRIRFAQNDAKVRGVALKDGDITPACAQTCPAEAIIFGDAHDPDSRVSRSKQDARGYHVLDMLNTKPGITYLERVIAATEA